MPTGTIGFIGQRLAEAREARGMTNGTLAELIGVSPTAISQYEKGLVSPRPETMTKLVERLNLPHSFFTRLPAAQANEVLFWRSLSSATQSARTKARRRFGWLKQIVAYLREYLDFPTVRLPRVDLPANILELSGNQIESIAQECRAFWGLGSGPIADFILCLENNGVIVSRGALEAEKLDAFSEMANDGTPYIFLTADKQSAVRSRLDAAHEVGHLILHRNIEEKQFNNPKIYKQLEDQAFRFGSAFLLPEKAFTSELWSPTLDAFRSLKERWRVSIGAMIKRCEELEMITEQETKRLFINYNRREWRIREPFDDTLIAEQPRLLRRSFELLISEGVKTRAQILLDLPFAPTDIEDLACLPSGYLTQEMGKLAFMPTLRTQNASERGDSGGTVVQFPQGLSRN
jgi:Zn-dependent peptidase ImmA (M78 family)/transcriptional regulator with XRE-family HTH domain